MKEKAQGSWCLQSVVHYSNGGYHSVRDDFEGTTISVSKDSMIWHNPVALEMGKGLFYIKSETIETNCEEDLDGNCTCDTETIYSFSAELDKLTPITQNYVDPIYIEAGLGEILNLDAQ